jgi:hypothetical protein
MLQRSAFFLVLLSAFFAPKSFADIAAIHANALPQETAVLGALDDARQLEPYSATWSAKWQYEISKEEVATRLGKDLGFLNLAAKSHPDNEELLLLTGLVARYAYNVDVDGSHDDAMDALGQAQKLAPTDFRVPWFRATLECQTMQGQQGAEEFLAIEGAHEWNALPEAYWHDYVNCATIANLPAHTLRAVSHLEMLHPGSQDDYAAAVDIAHNRVIPYDANKKYEPKDVWSGENAGDDSIFTSTLCGVRLHAHGNWEIDQMGMGNGSCIADFSTGPYKATKGDLRPSVLLLVQQPKQGESLQDYAKKFFKDGTFSPDPELQCPASDCIALKAFQSGMYGVNGDGHGRIVVFERGQPQFPGLIFESAAGFPKPDKSNNSAGAKYYRPNQKQGRVPGKLYYLLVLDTAASIEEPALKDFDFFLENLKVE